MAPRRKSTEKDSIPEEVEVLENHDTLLEQRPRLHKLTISNFRCIGAKPVEILLDDIVVLVGPNNVGKSSILRAFEVVMSHGSKEASLSDEDFPEGKVDGTNFPCIELETVVHGDNVPGDTWIRVENGSKYVRERWTWMEPGAPVRQGLEVATGEWSKEVPWGAPNVANSRRPQPHHIDAFQSPDKQAAAIISLLKEIITQRITDYKSAEPSQATEKSEYQLLLESVAKAQKKIVEDSKAEISNVENELTNFIKEIFPGYKVTFNARPEEDVEKCVTFFQQDSRLLMGPSDGYQSPIDKQGSGARRTLLWTALRLLSEVSPKKKGKASVSQSERPHVLLLDEPEICLHPSAIRDACRVLYDLPKAGNWQVMVTTHSPAFVDISRDNTTIIRVERSETGDVTATTVFRPEKVQMDEDDRKRLKLLNLYDPYVAEFFFGGKTVVVEGDTEYTAFKYIIANENAETFRNVHIVRARGKATIVSLIKILNQFGSGYSILHDSDRPMLAGAKRNGAWTTNSRILDAFNSNNPGMFQRRLIASKVNFEEAYLGAPASGEKPYNAIEQLRQDITKYENVKQLLRALVDPQQAPPANAIEWKSIDELGAAVGA